MSDEQLAKLIDRVRRWPPERQEEFAELADEIEAEMARQLYHATNAELQGIDEGFEGAAASAEEVEAAFAELRRK